MLPEISNNTKSLINGIKPFIQQRLFNINTQTKVVRQSLYINKDNNLDVKDRLDTNKISIAKPKPKSKNISSNDLPPPPLNNTTIKNQKVSSKNSDGLNKPSKKTGNKLNNRRMTKVEKPIPKIKKDIPKRKVSNKKNISVDKTIKKINKTTKTTKNIKNTKNKITTTTTTTNNKPNNRMLERSDETSYFTRQLEEIKIEELLLTNETQISIVSGPTSCGKTKLIQNALETLDIDYIIIESEDLINLESLYRTLKYQISPTLGSKYSKRNDEIINETMVFDLLCSIPEEIPIIIDDAYSLFTYVEDEDENDNVSLKINPVIFEWMYDGLENDKKLNLILVSSNPLVECWIDINIPNEIVCHCPIRDLTFDEAQDFFYSYLYEKGIDSIDLTFEDIYPITGTRLSIIKDFIQEYSQKADEDFNDLDFSMVNKLYNQLNQLLDTTDQPQLLKRIMAIMVSESDRGYVEEKELEYIFQNNKVIVEEEEGESRSSSKRKIKRSSQVVGSDDDFWEIIAMLIEHQLLNRNIMEFTAPELLPSSSSSRQYTQSNKNPVVIKRPVLFPENQCVIYAMNLILKDYHIQVNL